ncbi:MAG: HlyD family efflux transporter periplasmic adaptor subunit [Flavitalea sp.]
MATKKQIVPLAAIPHSVEMQLSKTHRGTQAIYITILLTVAVAFVLLFVIKTDVTVRSTGTIKALSERNDIRIPSEGVIDSIFISENKPVNAGEPLLKIKSIVVDQKNAALNQQYKDLKDRVHDLNILVSGKNTGLKSAVYVQQSSLYRQKMADATNRYNLATKNYERFSYLHKEKAVSSLELDQATFDKKAAESEASLVRQQQQTQWQTELSNYNTQLQELSSQLGINEEVKEQYVVKAAMKGTVQDLKGLRAGSVVAANEVIGNISPDESLIAEVYVSPKDIGLISAGSKVSFQIDAFNYNSWGDITGIAESVSDDVFTSEGKPYFKVRCRLDKTKLSLQNGYTGSLKKGMTMQARFRIARRTLFQLLYDETNDWLNPNGFKNESTAGR